MIAENKQEFFEQLGRELEKLGVEDTDELMADLEEHFAEGERRGVPESETCRELGSIAEIARSCLDLKSSAINSMVARDVERKKGVSLTKPGHSVPADPSLAPTGSTELPSYTPEHISEEIYPNAAPNAAQPTTNIGAGASDTASAAGNAAGGAAGSTANSSAGTESGTFERVGKAVDVAFDKAGKALNDAMKKAGAAVSDARNKTGSAVGSFRPSDSYREHINSGKHGGELPPQFTKAKPAGGSQFVDTTGLKPDPNAGRLLVEILLDVFLWIWLIPLVFSLVVAAFGIAVGLIVGGVECVIGHSGFAQFKFITRVLFMLGFFNLSAAVVCLAAQLLKAAISLVKNVISRHLKAIYDI